MLDEQARDHAIELLGSNTTPFERAALLALLETMPIDHSAASTVWNARTCAALLLPQLANALSVDLWDDGWPELKKRAVVDASPELHDLKTSIDGFRRFLDIVDCRLVDYVAPPQGFVAGATLSEDERRAWLRGLPELRLYSGGEPLPFDDGFAADLGYADLAAALDDRGRSMAARKARLFDPATGTLTDLGPVDDEIRDDGIGPVALERIAIPGPFDAEAFVADLAAADLVSAVPDDPARAPVFTWRTDTRGRGDALALLDAIPYGYGLVDVASVRVPITRPGDEGFFADAAAADVAFADEETAGIGFYDIFRLARVGERDGTPLMEAGGYADLDYIDWPTHTLHLLVDAASPADGWSFYAGISCADQACAVETDLTRLDQAMRAALAASGPSSDHVTLSTETSRFLALSDGIPLDGSFHFGKRVPRERA